MAAVAEGGHKPPYGTRSELRTSAGGRTLCGFFLSGVLFSFLGAILPAWGYHLRSEYLTISLYFLFLGFGIYVGTQICHRLVTVLGLRPLLCIGCGLAMVGLLALAVVSGPEPPSLRMFALFGVGIGGALLNSALFYAITPLYEHDRAATLNLAGALFGLGCLATSLLTAGTFGLYSVETMILVLALIPLAFLIAYWRGRPIEYTSRELPTFTQALRDFRFPGAVFFTLLLFFQFGNEWALAGWLPLFLIQQLGISPTTGLLMLALFWAALLTGRVAAQAMLPRFRHSRMLMASVIAACTGCILLSLTVKASGAVVAVILIGAGFASIYPLTSESLSHRVPYYHPGFFSGIFSLGLTGGLLTPSLLGVIANYGGVGMVMLLPALGAIMVCILVLLIWLEARLSGDVKATGA